MTGRIFTPETELFDPAAAKLLGELLMTPAPSGFEQPAAEVFTAYARAYADDVQVDRLGTAHATVNAGAGPRISLTGHLDEIGLIVTKIDDKGFLRCASIGGWDVAVLMGQRVRILTSDGPVLGSIGRQAIHILDPDARGKVPKLAQLWIDIGAEDGESARARVKIGDPAVVDVSPVQLTEHRLMSRSLDNRIGTFIALEVARACAGTVNAEVVAVGSVHEETGGSGAVTSTYAIDPDLAVAIDITTPSDTPGGADTGEFALGKGPILTRGATTSQQLVDSLIASADSADLPYQLRGMGVRTATDADSIVRAGRGVPVGLVSVPARYLHTPTEQVDLRDVRTSIDLLVAWIKDRAA